MQKSVKRQIFEPALFYASGFLLSWIVFKLTKHPYPHSLNLWMLIALLVFLSGVVWLLRTFVQLFSGAKYYWTLTVHILVIGGLLLSLILETNSSSNGAEIPSQTITVQSNPDDSISLVTGKNGDTLYFAKDSMIIINKLQ